jgi:transcriptional regulator with XRE-family HTH domain
MSGRTGATSDFPSGIIRTPEDIGQWVRRARKASGKTLAEAAALTGVGVRFLHELEHGKQTASLGKTLLVLQRMGLVLAISERRVR